MFRLLALVFRALSPYLRWRLLWAFHDKFILGVAGVVVDPCGQVLLLRHRFWRRDTWGLPAGYARSTETLAAALEREVREETGLEIAAPTLLYLVDGYKLRLEAFFLARLDSGSLRVDASEALEACFFAPAELPEGLLASHRQAIAAALASLSTSYPPRLVAARPAVDGATAGPPGLSPGADIPSTPPTAR